LLGVNSCSRQNRYASDPKHRNHRELSTHPFSSQKPGLVANRSARHGKALVVDRPLVIACREALPRFSTGTHYITNFDADSAR
jgi:hypothetical protein